MNEEEKFIIYTLEGSINTYIEGTKVIRVQLTTKQAEILLNLISKLQKELEQEKEKNKKLNLENQALFESINCNDDNMLARRYQKLQKELDKKDKLINLMYQDIECEYSGTSYVEYYSLENYYRRVEEENETN